MSAESPLQAPLAPVQGAGGGNGRLIEIKTKRGILRVGPHGELDGLWRIARAELRTNNEVRRHCGKAARETLKRWRRRAVNPFPEPVLTFSGSGIGGQLELWERTAVESWWRAEKLRREPRR